LLKFDIYYFGDDDKPKNPDLLGIGFQSICYDVIGMYGRNMKGIFSSKSQQTIQFIWMVIEQMRLLIRAIYNSLWNTQRKTRWRSNMLFNKFYPMSHHYPALKI
jgi:hypothetical protein